jgi:hypothetical protein
MATIVLCTGMMHPITGALASLLLGRSVALGCRYADDGALSNDMDHCPGGELTVPWNFRRIRKFGPLRFTLSKSGFSTSGAGGVRFTTSSRGTHVTVSRWWARWFVAGEYPELPAFRLCVLGVVGLAAWAIYRFWLSCPCV